MTLPGELGFYVVLPLYALLMYRIGKGAGGERSLRPELVVLAVLAIASVAVRVLTVSHGQLVPDSLAPILLYGTPGTFLWLALGMGMAAVSVALERGSVAPRALGLIAARPWLCWLGAAVIFLALAVAYPSPVVGSDPDGSTVALEFVGLGIVAALVMLPAVFGQEAGGFVLRVLANPVLAWLGSSPTGCTSSTCPSSSSWSMALGCPGKGPSRRSSALRSF